MARFINDLHFQAFVKSLDDKIHNYNEPTDKEGFYKAQKKQVETLVKLEKQFKNLIIKGPYASKIYKAFIDHINNNKRNILSARPYFRERQEVFTDNISEAIKNGNEKVIFKFNINFKFVEFVVNCHPWPKNGKVMKLFKEIRDLRNKIAELNMPLAISRAKIFWSCTPESHISYMDMIQTAAEGLMAAIDKFVLPFSRVFRSVIVGRVVGEEISAYSETFMHFYPNDRKKLYRANKIVRRFKDAKVIDYEELASTINKGLEAEGDIRTTPDELRELMLASSTVSSDSSSPIENQNNSAVQLTARFPATDESRPDVISERLDLSHKLNTAINELSIMEIKLLRLKGVNLNQLG